MEARHYLKRKWWDICLFIFPLPFIFNAGEYLAAFFYAVLACLMLFVEDVIKSWGESLADHRRSLNTIEDYHVLINDVASCLDRRDMNGAIKAFDFHITDIAARANEDAS